MDTQTRHALKQDRLVNTTRTSLDWFEDHRSRVVQAAVAAVLLLAFVIAALVVYNRRAAAADLAFGEAMDTYNAPLAQPGQPATPGEKNLSYRRCTSHIGQPAVCEDRESIWFFGSGKTARYFAGLTAIDLGQSGTAETDLKKVADGA